MIDLQAVGTQHDDTQSAGLRIGQGNGNGSNHTARGVKWNALVANGECGCAMFMIPRNGQLQANGCGQSASATMAKNVG